MADLKNKLETEKGKDAYPKAGVKLIYAGMYNNDNQGLKMTNTVTFVTEFWRIANLRLHYHSAWSCDRIGRHGD